MVLLFVTLQTILAKEQYKQTKPDFKKIIIKINQTKIPSKKAGSRESKSNLKQ